MLSKYPSRLIRKYFVHFSYSQLTKTTDLVIALRAGCLLLQQIKNQHKTHTTSTSRRLSFFFRKLTNYEWEKNMRSFERTQCAVVEYKEIGNCTETTIDQKTLIYTHRRLYKQVMNDLYQVGNSMLCKQIRIETVNICVKILKS